MLLLLLGHPIVSESEMRIALSDISGKNSEHVSLIEFEAWYERSLFWNAHKERAHGEQEACEGRSISVFLILFSSLLSLYFPNST